MQKTREQKIYTHTHTDRTKTDVSTLVSRLARSMLGTKTHPDKHTACKMLVFGVVTYWLQANKARESRQQQQQPKQQQHTSSRSLSRFCASRCLAMCSGVIGRSSRCWKHFLPILSFLDKRLDGMERNGMGRDGSVRECGFKKRTQNSTCTREKITKSTQEQDQK